MRASVCVYIYHWVASNLLAIMRKYTQLGLVIITIASIIVLLMYRNEYRQLKYVLDVVNFIGRKDEMTLVHLENETSVYQHTPYQFDDPLPIWQRIGNGFHAYSSFWIKPNDLRTGGEVIAIVASFKHSMVRFKCEVQYSNGQMQKGKFVFTREDIVAGSDTANTNGPSDDFIVYKFVCKVGKEYGIPTQIVFTDLSASTRHRIPVRNLQHKKVDDLLTMTMCVNLVPRNQSEVDAFSTDFNLLQFFLHHQLIGIDEFLVYGSSQISSALKRTLYVHGIKLNLFPFNFPYDLAHLSKVQTLIQSDCLLRTSNAVEYTIFSTAHDFIYVNSNLMSRPQPLLQMLKNPLYGSDVRYDIIGNPICRHSSKRILSDNLMLSANISADYSKVTLFKTKAMFTKYQNVVADQHAVTSRIQKNLIFYNHYRDCDEQAMSGNLVDWRTLISDDFRQFVDQIGVNINAILQNEH